MNYCIVIGQSLLNVCCIQSFKEDFPNGYILNNDKSPIIKTPNGAIKLIDWEADSEIMFKQGEVFNERR